MECSFLFIYTFRSLNKDFLHFCLVTELCESFISWVMCWGNWIASGGKESRNRILTSHHSQKTVIRNGFKTAKLDLNSWGERGRTLQDMGLRGVLSGLIPVANSSEQTSRTISNWTVRNSGEDTLPSRRKCLCSQRGCVLFLTALTFRAAAWAFSSLLTALGVLRAFSWFWTRNHSQ